MLKGQNNYFFLVLIFDLPFSDTCLFLFKLVILISNFNVNFSSNENTTAVYSIFLTPYPFLFSIISVYFTLSLPFPPFSSSISLLIFPLISLSPFLFFSLSLQHHLYLFGFLGKDIIHIFRF